MKVASTGEHLIKYQIPQAGYYYVVIISDSPIDYTNFYMSLCPLNIGISPDEPEMRSVLESEGCGVCRTITPIPLSCGATYEGDLTGQREKFNKNSEPYDHCTGTSGRDYGGPDAVHKFTIDVPSFVSITLDGKSSLMGMFLYDYACGQHCLDVAENSAQGGTASFAPIFLIPGEYYILVDKELSVGGVSNKYSLTIKCEVSSNQDFVSDESACPKTTTAPHQVRVRSVGALLMNSLSLSLKDRISFVYDKGQQNYVLEKGQFWNGQELVFDFFADNSGDPLKCGYVPGDSFEIRITNEGRVKYVKPVFNTNTNQLYSPGAQSTITDFIQLKENSFFISPNTHRIGFTKGINFEILLQAGNSTSWNISALPNWLSVSQMGGVGPAELLFTTLSDNPSSRIRIATIQITNAENVLRTFFVVQKGCTAASVDLGFDRQVCIGDPVALNAVGTGTFKWSTGSVSSTISVPTNTAGTRSYSITATGTGCTATDTIKVTVNPKPVANAGLDQSICSGSNAILRASGGSSFKWSNNATTSEISVSPAATQNFSVTVTQNGCEATDQVNVKVNPNPIVVKESVNPFTGPFGNIQVRVSGGTPNYKFQWFRNDTLISTQEDLIGLKSGTHKLIVTDVNGCTATFGPELIMATVTSLNDVSNLEQLDIFPNPSNGLLNIKGRLRQSEAMQFTILDALGKRVWASQRMAHKEFNFNPDLSEHAPGLYIIQLEVNGKMLRRKLIIH
ncbi:MAG TPA: T9SS type A sorting domain-containing protein [Haliscomenobacter sp.]|nr:T9SS type A sorting domain-containing protein [Haliscomenobacter sp.]